MKINIKTVHRTDKLNKNNTAPIHIRFNQKGKIYYISTSVILPLDAWDAEKQQIIKGYPNATELQLQITSVRAEYEKKIKRLEALEIEVNFDTLFEKNTNKQSNCSLKDFFYQQVEHMESIGKIGTASKYRSCLALLSQCGSVDISFDKIDMNYLRDFETFLIQKGNISNSIATKFSVFKAVYNRAIENEIFTPNNNPFIKFKVGRYWKPTRKRAISKEDIIKLKDLILPKDSLTPYLDFARDIFLFSYYTAGINFKDIATLQFCNIENGRVYYSRHKTSKEMSSTLMPEALRIIEKYRNHEHTEEDYIFPILDRRIHVTEQQIYNRIHKVLGKVNSSLKELSTMIGLKTPITTYVARHTFATVLKRSGVNIAIISESLGHSDLSTTQIYLDSFENSQIDEAMKNLL